MMFGRGHFIAGMVFGRGHFIVGMVLGRGHFIVGMVFDHRVAGLSVAAVSL